MIKKTGRERMRGKGDSELTVGDSELNESALRARAGGTQNSRGERAESAALSGGADAEACRWGVQAVDDHRCLGRGYFPLGKVLVILLVLFVVSEDRGFKLI